MSEGSRPEIRAREGIQAIVDRSSDEVLRTAIRRGLSSRDRRAGGMLRVGLGLLLAAATLAIIASGESGRSPEDSAVLFAQQNRLFGMIIDLYQAKAIEHAVAISDADGRARFGKLAAIRGGDARVMLGGIAGDLHFPTRRVLEDIVDYFAESRTWILYAGRPEELEERRAALRARMERRPSWVLSRWLVTDMTPFFSGSDLDDETRASILALLVVDEP